MKKLILKSMMLLSVLALTFTSCSDNDDKVVTTPVSLSIEMPLGLENIVLSNAKAVFTNVTTNETFIQEQFQEKNGSFMASLADVPEGTYNVAISGDLSFTKDGIAGSSKIRQCPSQVGCEHIQC